MRLTRPGASVTTSGGRPKSAAKVDDGGTGSGFETIAGTLPPSAISWICSRLHGDEPFARAASRRAQTTPYSMAVARLELGQPHDVHHIDVHHRIRSEGAQCDRRGALERVDVE